MPMSPVKSTATGWPALYELSTQALSQGREERYRRSLFPISFTAALMGALGGVNGTVCNAQQYRQSLQSYGSLSPSISCLTHGEIIGLVLAAEASLISCICIIIIFIWIGWNVHWYRKKFPNGDWELFQRPADIYMFFLFVFDLVQATGGFLNIKWAHNGTVTTGPYCTAQGLVEQIGDTGVALMTLLLAIHTFVAAVWQVGLRARGFAIRMVCLACVFIALWAGIGGGVNKNYETPTPYWCWISPQFKGERIGGEYLWMWIALFGSVTLYIPLYFWADGFWGVKYAQRRDALGVLLYPLTYSLVILPLSVARWLTFSHHHVPSAVTFFCKSLFHLSGAINVILFLVIRSELLLFPRHKELAGEEVELAPPDTGPAPRIFPDAVEIQHSPEPTSGALGNEGPRRDSATPSRASSGRISI